MQESYLSLLRRERRGGLFGGAAYSRVTQQYGFSNSNLIQYKKLKTGNIVQHEGCINTIRWSKNDNGRYMVTGSDDMIVKIWDCADYMNDVKLAAEVETGHLRNIFCAEICPHKPNRVVSCAADGTVRMNDIHIGASGNRHEDMLSSSYCIAHMFQFDVTQPDVVYVCEDRGRLMRIDTRAGNECSSIYKSVRRDHSVKAVAQSDAFGAHYLFVGGQGFVVRQLDVRKLESNGNNSNGGGGRDGSEMDNHGDGDDDSSSSSEDSSNPHYYGYGMSRKALARGKESVAVVAKYSPHGLSRCGRRAVSFGIDMTNTPDSISHSPKSYQLINNCSSSSSSSNSSSEWELNMAEHLRTGRAKWQTSSFRKSEQHVSVSGMEISGDGTSLLVSYQSDQVYTFPLLGHTNKGEMGEEVGGNSGDGRWDYHGGGWSAYSKYKQPHEVDWHDECTCPYIGAEQIFGGHINYATFLKQVSFFGPRDEYILSGSDSGHIFIWDAKRSGHLVPPGHARSSRVSRLVNVLKGDKRTVNGVMAHPTLPLFASYGIDSDAKLWAYVDQDYNEEESEEDDDGDDDGDDYMLPAGVSSGGGGCGGSPEKKQQQGEEKVAFRSIVSDYCTFPDMWRPLDAKRVPYNGSAALFHRAAFAWNPEDHSETQTKVAPYARDRRVFDMAQFHDTICGLLRDMSQRGVLGYGHGDNTLITSRYPGKDPLPGLHEQYSLSDTEPFDLVLALEQRDHLVDPEATWYQSRQYYSEEREGGEGDGGEDGAVFASLARIVMDPRALPRGTDPEALLHEACQWDDGDSPPFQLSQPAELSTSSSLPCAAELVKLFGAPFVHLAFVATAVLRAGNRLKDSGTAAVRAGEAHLSLPFYSRAHSHADFISEVVTGNGKTCAYQIHDAAMRGFTSKEWMLILYPPEDEVTGKGLRVDHELHREKQRCADRAILALAVRAGKITAEEADAEEEEEEEEEMSVSSDEEEREEDEERRVREERDAMMADEIRGTSSVPVVAAAAGERGATGSTCMEVDGASAPKKAKYDTVAAASTAKKTRKKEEKREPKQPSRRTTVLVEERNRLIIRADRVHRWKRGVVALLDHQALLLQFQSMNNLLQALTTLKRPRQVALLGPQVGTKAAICMESVKSRRKVQALAAVSITSSSSSDGGDDAARIALASERDKDAESTWRKGLTKLWFRVGSAQLSLKRYSDALESLEKAAALDPADKSVTKKLQTVKEAIRKLEARQKQRLQNAFRAASQSTGDAEEEMNE
jgi:WD40 repeat protein